MEASRTNLLSSEPMVYSREKSCIEKINLFIASIEDMKSIKFEFSQSNSENFKMLSIIKGCSWYRDISSTFIVNEISDNSQTFTHTNRRITRSLARARSNKMIIKLFDIVKTSLFLGEKLYWPNGEETEVSFFKNFELIIIKCFLHEVASYLILNKRLSRKQ